MEKVATLSVLLFIFIFWAIPESSASSLSWKRQQLYEARKNLRAVRKRLNEANIREQDLSRQLCRTQRQIRTLKQDMIYLNKKISSSLNDIRCLRAELQLLQERHTQKQLVFQKRLKDIYLNDNNNILQVFMGSRDFSEFISHSDYLGRICNEDEQLIKTLRIEQEAIRFKQRQINNKYHRMLSYRGYLRQKRESLESIEDKREELLEEVEKQKKYYQQRKYELEEHTYELEQEVQQLIREYQRRQRTHSAGSSTPAYSTGDHRWPVNGVLTSNFGWRIHPIFGGYRYHTGVDIGAGYGSAIKATDGGTIIYSGWCGGYGNTVMIDHGKGIVTLYAHCSSIYVNNGQSVAKGQVIAAVGSTGNSTGPHLHFEVRQDGVPVNPWGYLK